MTFDECLEEIKRESPEARKCIEIAEGIADIMYKEDYVKVVRCRDCKHRYSEGENVRYNLCELNRNKAMPDYWFCADGERS